MQHKTWQIVDLKTQKEEYGKQALAYQALRYIMDWARDYTSLARPSGCPFRAR